MGFNDHYDYYSSIDRPFEGGPDYYQLSLNALRVSFPHVPIIHLTQRLQWHRGFYVPTHLSLLNETSGGVVGTKEGGEESFNPLQESKGKGRELACHVFYEEKRWLDGYLNEHHSRGLNAGQDRLIDASLPPAAHDLTNESTNDTHNAFLTECGCCFSEFSTASMIQCPNAHKFCQACLQTYSSTQLTTRRDPILRCIDTSGCSLPFHDSDLRRLLPPKLLSLYERLAQLKALKDANVKGLEECPFCPWLCVIAIPVEQDVLFRCGNQEGECGIEAQEDKHLDGRVMIEEAMSKALVRECPNPDCTNKFIKEGGVPGKRGSSSKAKKCPMWEENTDQRHQDEVDEACRKAFQEYKRHHPDVVIGKDIKIDLVPSRKKSPTTSRTPLPPRRMAPTTEEQIRMLRRLQQLHNLLPRPATPPHLVPGRAPPTGVPVGGGMQPYNDPVHVAGPQTFGRPGAQAVHVQNPPVQLGPTQRQAQNLVQLVGMRRLSNLHSAARAKVQQATNALGLARAQAAQTEQLLLQAREWETQMQRAVESGERELAEIGERMNALNAFGGSQPWELGREPLRDVGYGDSYDGRSQTYGAEGVGIGGPVGVEGDGFGAQGVVQPSNLQAYDQVLEIPTQERSRNPNENFEQDQYNALLLRFAEMERLSNMHILARSKVQRATTTLGLARAQAAQAVQTLLRAREREVLAQRGIEEAERESAEIQGRMEQIPRMVLNVLNTQQARADQFLQRGGFGVYQHPLMDDQHLPPVLVNHAQPVVATVDPQHLHGNGNGNGHFGMIR
ncbi:hypothetical protein MD484_g5023, partial [Candolleomyces efflorescens]